MKLRTIADNLDGAIAGVMNNPKIKTEKRKKQLIVDTWNAYLGQTERYTQDEKLKCIYLMYEGMITNNIAARLTPDELHNMTQVITEEMRNSQFNNWKWRKKK